MLILKLQLNQFTPPHSKTLPFVPGILQLRHRSPSPTATEKSHKLVSHITSELIVNFL